ERLVIYEAGRVVQAAPKGELLLRPASETVARLIGMRNIVRGTVVKASPDRIEIAWRGHNVEAVDSLGRPYLAPSGTPVAFFVRPEYVRLVRKDRTGPDPGHHMNMLSGTVVGEVDQGTAWMLLFRVDAPGEPSQGGFDLEIEIPKLVYEMLDVARDRRWSVSMHRGALQVLPLALPPRRRCSRCCRCWRSRASAWATAAGRCWTCRRSPSPRARCWP